MLRASALLLIILAVSQSLFGALDPKKLPKPTGYVSDLANVVDAEHKQQLEQFCLSVQQQLGAQFALVTIPSLEGQPIRDFAIDLARTWGVGPARRNDGVLLLLAVNDRQNDIEVGYGLEQYLTDGFSGSTLRAMRPDLRAGNYGAALLQAANAMAKQIAQGKGITFQPSIAVPEPREPEEHKGGIPISLIIFLGVFFLLWLANRGGRRGGGFRGGGGGGILPWLILSNMGGGRGGNWDSGWGGGGFGGGSGGGGGFGGFGGGDFGGGGASSNW